MKVKWILGLIIVSFLSQVKAYSIVNLQANNSFLSESKLWHCKEWKMANGTSQDKYYYFQGDTVINDISSQKMYVKYSKESITGNYQGALYADGDKIFVCHTGASDFCLLYDFGVSKGDKVTVGGIDVCIVKDVSQMEVNGESLRVIYIQSEFAEEDSEETGNVWVEGFGSKTMPLHSGQRNPGNNESFVACEEDGVVVLDAEDIPDYVALEKFHPIAIDGKEWILTQTIPGNDPPYVTTIRQWIDGDTLVNGVVCKRLYTHRKIDNDRIAEEYQEKFSVSYCRQDGNKFYLEEDLLYDFDQKVSDPVWGGSIAEIGQTTTIDGVSRKYQLVKSSSGDQDILVEGIGSLTSGIFMPSVLGIYGASYELRSVSLNGKYLYNKKGTVSPVDKTHLLVNPDYANNDNTGWSGTTPAFQTYQNAEHYNKKFNTYQDLENLPNGVYAVSLQGFYRANTYESPLCAKLYAKSGEDSLNTSLPSIHAGAVETPYGFNSVDEIQAGNKDLYIPSTLKAAATYLQHEAYCTTLFFAVEGGNARIGLAKDTLIGLDWTAWQDWNLAYYGNDEAAYQSWLDFAKSKAPRFDEVVLTVGLLDAYNALLSDNSVSNKAEVLSAIHALEEKTAELKANSEAWMAYDKAVKELQTIIEDPTILEFGDCDVAYYDSKEYYEQTALEIIQSRLLTTEEVIAETQQVETLINMFSYSPSLLRKPPVNKSYIQIEALDRPVARLVVDLTVPDGYTQQIDSIVGPRIYVSGTYTWDGGTSSAHRIEMLDLGELPEGSYYLQHQIKDLSESKEGPETSYFISFSIKSPESYGKDPLQQEIVNQSYLYPTLKTADDEIILVTDLMVNCSYQQQIDSIVGDQVYLSGSYDLYSVNCPVSPTISQFSLGKYSPGKYTLHHRIAVKNGSEVLKETTYTIPFVVRAGSQIEEIDSDHLLVVDGKEWNSEVVAPLPPQYASYRSRQYISGDTIYQGESYKVLYEQRWFIGGKETEEILALIRQVGNKVYSTHPRLYYDFGLFQGDFVEDYAWGTSETRGGWLIKEVSDTILTDGISRRCLKVDYVVIPKDGERFIEYSDIWVEGIGSLYHGLVLQSPAVSGWGDYTLESVLSDGKYQYVKEVFGINLQTQKKSKPTYHSADGTFRCASPTATLLEVYTPTGIKVGEATFQNGEAVVKVGETSHLSLYLYVVIYPDGTRSCGKVMGK